MQLVECGSDARAAAATEKEGRCQSTAAGKKEVQRVECDSYRSAAEKVRRTECSGDRKGDGACW